MPIYEYLCDKCEHVLEVQQKISDPPPEACPECGADAPSRILSVSNIGSVASGRDAAACERSPDPSCFTCGKAGTGCS